jgi:hypothetical protein
LGQDKDSSLWLFWEGGGVFLAPSIFSVNTFQFATNFRSLTFTLRTMRMVMYILNIYMRPYSANLLAGELCIQSVA